MGANREATGFPRLPSFPQLNPQSCKYLQTGRRGQALSLPGADILVLMSALVQGLGLPWGGKRKAEGGQTGRLVGRCGRAVRKGHWERLGGLRNGWLPGGVLRGRGGKAERRVPTCVLTTD